MICIEESQLGAIVGSVGIAIIVLAIQIAVYKYIK